MCLFQHVCEGERIVRCSNKEGKLYRSCQYMARSWRNNLYFREKDRAVIYILGSSYTGREGGSENKFRRKPTVSVNSRGVRKQP